MIIAVNAEVTGSNPVEALIFFRLLLSNCLNWKIYCDDHSFSFFSFLFSFFFILFCQEISSKRARFASEKIVLRRLPGS